MKPENLLRDSQIQTFNNDAEMRVIQEWSFELNVNMWKFPWYSPVDKFWVNSEVKPTSDPEDVWEWWGRYIYDADWTAPIVSIWAETDIIANQEISVIWLDIDWNEVTQIITLDWTNRVALTTPLWRVYRMSNEWTTDFDWYVFCYTWTWSVPSIWDSEVRALINNSAAFVKHNQTLMTLYTIPKWKVWFLYRWEIWVELEWNTASLSEYAHCHYESRRFWKVFKVKKAITCIVWWNAVFQDRRSFPDIIPALTDIKLSAIKVTQTMWLWGTFDILLVDEDKFSTEYLQVIWQPWY